MTDDEIKFKIDLAETTLADLLPERKRRIIAAVKAGTTYEKVAEAWGLTRQRVGQIIKAERAAKGVSDED